MFLDLDEVLAELSDISDKAPPEVPRFLPLAPENIGPEDLAKMERDARSKFATLAGKAAQERQRVSARERQAQKNAWSRAATAAGRTWKKRDRRAYDRARYLARKGAQQCAA